MCRLDESLAAVVNMWRERPESRMRDSSGKPMSMDVQVCTLMRYTLRRLIAKDIGPSMIKREGRMGGKTVSRYRVNVPNNMHLLMTGVLQANGLSSSLLMRAAIRMHPDIAARLDLETLYTERQGLGDPEWFSDDFLYLWSKYNSAGGASEQVRIVRSIRDLELKFQTVIDKLGKLDLLFRTYGVKGIIACDEVPIRKAIECMDITAMRALSTKWGIRLLSTDNEDKVRSRILRHFGYSRGE